MTEIENEKIKLISTIYDEICEEIRLVKRYSLPYNKPIETGKNYTSYKNLYLFLVKLGITDPDHIKLYLRSQFEELWKIYKFKKKVIPIGMMYNTHSVERHLKYILDIKEKYKIYDDSIKLEKILDSIINSPLVYDYNCLSLSFDINFVYKLLIKSYEKFNYITESNFLDIILYVNNQTTEGICPGYLITIHELSTDFLLPIVKKRIKIIKDIKNRGDEYYSNILTKKFEIIERDILPQLNNYDDKVKNEILKWL